MKILSKLSTLFIFLLFFISSTTFAEVPKPTVKTTSTQAVILASVDIKDAKIVSQKGNIFNISFSFFNRGGLQTGVKYGVKLVSESKTGQTTIDEKVYDESLTLNSNAEIQKNVVYIAPAFISGSYSLVLTSSNSSGFPFDFINLGKVTFTSTSAGIQILTETCKVQTFNLTQRISVNLGENINLSCEARNSSKVDLIATPSYEVRLGTSFGDVINQNGGSTDPITFKPGEKKSFSVTLPKATASQLYNVNFTLNSESIKSNPINFNYIVLGTSATVYNLSLDKDYYNKGDKALVSLVAISNSSSTITSKIQISNGKGKSCAKPQTEALTIPILPKVESSVAITSSCLDPKISVTLTDDKGIVLAQKEFNIKTTSGVTHKASNSSIIWIIIIILIIIILYFYFKKKANTPPATSTSVPMGVLFFFLLIASFGIIPVRTVKAADTVSVGPSRYAVVGIDKTTYYYPGDNVNGSATLWDTSSGQNASGTIEDSIPDASAQRSGLYSRSISGVLAPPRSYVGLGIPSTSGTHNTTFYISAYINTTSVTVPDNYTACLSNCNLTPTYTYYYQLNADGSYSPWYAPGGPIVSYKFIKTPGYSYNVDNYTTATYNIPFNVVVPVTTPLTVNVWAENIYNVKTATIPSGDKVNVYWTPSSNATSCSCEYKGTLGDCGSGIGSKVPSSVNPVTLIQSKTFNVTCNDVPATITVTPTTQYWFKLHSCQDASNYETGPYSTYNYSTGDLLAGALDNGTYNYRVVGSATSSYGYPNIGVSKASVITCPY